jgi:hypothetical protein
MKNKYKRTNSYQNGMTSDSLTYVHLCLYFGVNNFPAMVKHSGPTKTSIKQKTNTLPTKMKHTKRSSFSCIGSVAEDDFMRPLSSRHIILICSDKSEYEESMKDILERLPFIIIWIFVERIFSCRGLYFFLCCVYYW